MTSLYSDIPTTHHPDETFSCVILLKMEPIKDDNMLMLPIQIEHCQLHVFFRLVLPATVMPSRHCLGIITCTQVCVCRRAGVLCQSNLGNRLAKTAPSLKFGQTWPSPINLKFSILVYIKCIIGIM